MQSIPEWQIFRPEAINPAIIIYPTMSIIHHEEQEILSYALTKICHLCTQRSCIACTVYSLRIQLDLQQDLPALEAENTTTLPDTFLFHTSINQLTCHNTYHASREEGFYHISLPRIGEICQFSVENMEDRIRKQYFQIIADL